MKKLLFSFLSVLLVLTLISCSGGKNNGDHLGNSIGGTPNKPSNNTQTKQLSSECDVLLCSGTDLSSNYYELVGNQTETSQGFEITLGVIKNNSWLIPLSSNSEFLGSDGLFDVNYVIGGHKAIDLYSAGEFFNFVETGGFVMESIEEENGLFGKTHHYCIFLSCSTSEYLKIDTDEYKVRYAKYKNTNDVCTDNGQILVYKETSGSSDGTKLTYDWYILNTNSLKMNKIASDKHNLYPENILSEGLIFASDKCFYDTNMNKKMDLSNYNIDMWYDSGEIFFQDGTCVFNVKNQLGTTFEITIDKTGKVLSEIQK